MRAAALITVLAALGVVTGCGSMQNAAYTAPAPTQSQPAPPASSLDEGAFWQLIEETRGAAGNDTGRQSELLQDRLTQLSPQAIVDFANIRASLDRRAYTWNLWAAAYVIDDGCSDDCFRDFRGYLISLGRARTRSAIRIHLPRSFRTPRAATGKTPTTLCRTPTRA